MNWPKIAEKLAVSIPCSAWHPAVLAWLASPENDRARLGVALSGGADSVALLLLLWAHFPARRTRLLALHFDHRLRGRASTADARFCARLCRALDVELATDRWMRNDNEPASEARARGARIQFFDTTLRRRRIQVLCTGHHRDDVAETLFMRLARGAGAAGLAAPRPVHAQAAHNRVHLRPLLTLDKALIAESLRVAGGRWREDASNTSEKHLRNRVRARLIPTWRETAAEPGRDALAGLALSRDLLEEDDIALETWAEQATRIDARGTLAIKPLRRLPRAVLRRVLHRWLASTPIQTDLNRRGFNALLDLVTAGRTGARHSLGSGHFAKLGRTRLLCENAEAASPSLAKSTKSSSARTPPP